jgi:hypothetical protein
MGFWLRILVFLFGGASIVSAQSWQIATPRQVLPVPSGGSVVNFPNVNLVNGMKYRVHASGVVTVSSSGDMSDACYYIFNSFLHFNPNITPVSLKLRNSPTNEDWFYNFWNAAGFQGGNYQSSHVYDASIPSLGSPLSFRFFDTKEPPSPYYSDNVGSILIDVARETPGIAVQYDTLNFGLVKVGIPKTLVDSIEGYGIDKYHVDNVSMLRASAAKFSVSSQPGVVPFFLDTTDELRFTYSPTANGPDTAEFHIFSSTAFGADKEKIIYLFGNGVSTQLAFRPDTLDFGTVRTGSTKVLPDTILNLNNTSVTIVSITPEVYGPVFFAAGTPFSVLANNSKPVFITFAPTADGAYFEKFDVLTDDGSMFHFFAKGFAGVPVVSLEKDVLDFGKVILGQSKLLTDNYANVGTAPLNIVSTKNTNPLEYIVGSALLPSYEPGHGIVISVTFSPQIHIPLCANHDGAFIITYDDGTSTTITFKGCDHKPLDTKLAIDTLYFAKAGEAIDVTQQLVTIGDPLDSTLDPVTGLTESIHWDGTLFDFVSASKATLISGGAWNFNATSPSPGLANISISTTTSRFTAGGDLLTLRLQAHANAKVGQFTSLVQNNLNFDNPLEPLAVSDPGKITIADNCSPVRLITGFTTSVEQNNPNPFNRTTHIFYAIGKNAGENPVPVKIILYDQMGRLAGVLVNEQKTPGKYDYLFDGSAYSNGAYMYLFQAGDHVERKTMLLVK